MFIRRAPFQVQKGTGATEWSLWCATWVHEVSGHGGSCSDAEGLTPDTFLLLHLSRHKMLTRTGLSVNQRQRLFLLVKLEILLWEDQWNDPQYYYRSSFFFFLNSVGFRRYNLFNTGTSVQPLALRNCTQKPRESLGSLASPT